MASLREEKKKKTKQAILKAAVKLFGKKGFDKTSISALAKEAGIGKGTIYTYFQTKSDILYAFCEEQLEFIHQELAKKANGNDPLIDQLMTVFMGEFLQVTSNRDFGRFFMQQTLFPNDTDKDRYEHVDNKWLELLYSIFRHAQRRGELREDIDILYIAGHFYALYVLAISSWYSGRIELERIEPGMRILFEQVLDGLAPSSSQNNRQETR